MHLEYHPAWRRQGPLPASNHSWGHYTAVLRPSDRIPAHASRGTNGIALIWRHRINSNGFVWVCTSGCVIRGLPQEAWNTLIRGLGPLLVVDIDMDRNRVDKLLITKVNGARAAQA